MGGRERWRIRWWHQRRDQERRQYSPWRRVPVWSVRDLQCQAQAGRDVREFAIARTVSRRAGSRRTAPQRPHVLLRRGRTRAGTLRDGIGYRFCCRRLHQSGAGRRTLSRGPHTTADDRPVSDVGARKRNGRQRSRINSWIGVPWSDGSLRRTTASNTMRSTPGA